MKENEETDSNGKEKDEKEDKNEKENSETNNVKADKEDNNNIDNIQNNNEGDIKNYIICHDKTIIEVSDKKWNRYLIPYKAVLESKRQIRIQKSKNSYKDTEPIELIDYNEKKCNIPGKIIEEYNENNLTYHWLQVSDVNDKLIVVKKEHLLMQKISNEEKEILDYNGKKYKIIPGKVCRLAKKYHITTGLGEQNILYLIKDSSGEFHFVTKTIIKFAKTKRALNDEMHTLEITDKDNTIINVNSDTIRDLEDFNPYSEWC